MSPRTRATVALLVVTLVTVGLAAGLPRLTTRLDLLSLYASVAGREAAAPAVLLALPDGTPPDAVAAARAALDQLDDVTSIQTLVVPEPLPPPVQELVATAMWGRGEARPAVLRATLSSTDHLERLDRVASAHGGALLGLPVLDEAHRQLVTGALGQLLAIVAVVFFAILVALWRRPLAALVPLLSVAVGVVWLLGLLGWFGVPLGGPMLALVPLVVVLGLTDAIHVAWRLAPVARDPDAVPPALAEVARACAWTSITTGAGLLALLATDAAVLHRFGTWGAVGMALVYVTGVGLPAALILRFPALAPRPVVILAPAPGRFLHRRGLAIGLVVVMLIGLAAAARTVRVDLIPGNDLPADHPVLERHLAHDRALGGLHPVRVRVRPMSPAGTADAEAFAALVRIQRAAVNHRAVGSAVSFADAMLVAGRGGQRTVDQMVGRTDDRRTAARARRYERSRLHALEAASHLTDLPLDDGERWTMHLRLHHVPASQWANLFRTLRRVGGDRVRIAFEGYPLHVVRTRGRLRSDAWAVFGIAGSVALGCLVLLMRRPAALVALPLVAVTGLAVLAGLAVSGVALSHANLFALSVAIGVAIDPWIHLAAGSSASRREGEPSARAGLPIVVGQGLVAVGLLLLATSELTTLAQTGPVLAGAVVLNGVVTALLWISGRPRAAAP